MMQRHPLRPGRRVAVAVVTAATVAAAGSLVAYGSVRPPAPLRPAASPVICNAAQGQPSCPPPCALGASGAEPDCPVPPPCVRPCPTVVVTQADSGRTFTLAPGTALVVRLRGSPQFLWSAPQSSDTSVLRSEGSTSDPATGDAVGRFAAVARGQAHVNAVQQAACAHRTPPCPTPIRLFTVTVDVS